MATPDVVVNISGASGAGAVAADIDQAFIVGQTQRGSIVKPTLEQSPNDYTLYSGARQTTSPMYDVVDDYFHEGPNTARAYVSRVASSTAAQATLNLLDASAGTSLVVKAGLLGDADPGVWANGSTGGLSVAVVVASGAFQLQTSLNGVQVESSPYFTTQADAIGWATKNSNYLQLTLGASSLLPAAAAGAPLASGSDGSALVDADYQAAFDRISLEYGPGQVFAPGRVTNTGYLQVIAHAVAKNRFYLLDAPDTSNDATIESAAQGVFSAPSNGRRWGQMIAPWDMGPGLTTYTLRDIPPSARLAAQYARLQSFGNPNMSAAGRNGVAQWIQDLSQPNFTSTQRDALALACVTLSRRRFGGAIMTYGNRTLADPNLDQNWSMAPNVRAVMWFAHQARLVGDMHNFDDVDPFGHELAAFQGDLFGKAKILYDAGALWCPTQNPSDAISIDVGPSANPPSQLAQGIVQANCELRFSPTPDRTVINVIKTPMTQGL